MMRTYNLFISHSWAYSDAYEKLVGLLEGVDRFFFKDYSVPKSSPVHNAPDAEALEAAIRLQMQPTSVVLILAGVYATYSKWINIEIRLAQKGFMNPKPIIAIEPFGSQKTSITVKSAADQIVGWRAQSVIDAIRKWG